MASVNTAAGLQDEILRRLGAPIIQVEVSTDMIKDSIDRAIELFAEYHHEGARKVYLSLQVSQADIDRGGFFYVDRPILAISEVIYSTNQASAQSFMNVFPQWIGYSTGGVNGGGYGAQGMFSQNNTFSLLTADLWNQYASAFEEMFSSKIMYEWNQHTRELSIFNNLQVDQLIVLECWVPAGVPLSRLMNPETSDGEYNAGHVENPEEPQFNNGEGIQNILNNRWIKDFSTALVKQMNGTVLKKFSGQKLPGGIEVDGQRMYEEATSEIEELKEELYSLERPLPIIVG